MAFQQRKISEVRLVAGIEQIAEQRDRTSQEIHPGVDDHARNDDFRDAKTDGVQQHHHREETGDDITDARDQPDDRVEAESQLRSGHLKRGIEQIRPFSQCRQRPIVRTRGTSLIQHVARKHVARRT